MGEWIGVGSGKPGEGAGGFALHLDLQNTILVRTNYSEFPAIKEKPAYRHDDLMIVYQSGDGSMRGIYFDNEQHVIHYDVDFFAGFEFYGIQQWHDTV